VKRIESIDIVRGLVMVIMALDHTRDFNHISSLTQNPLDLATTTPLLFLTRWITHLCAPVFVFLAGSSAYLSARTRNNMTESRKFLLKRGLVLILLELTVINFALWFDIHFRILLFEVIAAIGFGFILISLVMKLPGWALLTIGLTLICCHDLFAMIHFSNGSIVKVVLSPLFGFSLFQVTPKFIFSIAYPPLDWFGIMVTGFAFGRIFEMHDPGRKKALLLSGVVALLAFLLLRSINIYGDPSTWAAQKNFTYTLLSFINVSKYPPSLLFTLMTLGVMFLLLFISEGGKGAISRILIVYGKVPLFFFVIHLYLIHGIMVIIMFLQGYGLKEMSFEPFRYGRAPGSGVSLAVVYLLWIGVVVLLYPICRWYGKYKSARRDNILMRYL
jgi:uncharacterized membrane protein